MRVVIALGGNALLRRGQPLEAELQRRNVLKAARAIAAVAREHQVIVTHGNGPQVGLLALESAAYRDVAPYPLDVLGAESQGMIGYLVETALRNELRGVEVATVLSQVEVDGDDPAFAAPSKPIGPLYGEAEARRLAREHGWFVAPDAGGFRRVVPSPLPKRIVEVASLRLLLDAGVLVISAGGGGVPVVIDADGRATGVEAVVDKDLTAALLARRVGASALLLLTDVEAVFADWATPTARAIRGASPADLRGFAFAPGSMAPKVEAACEFAEATGGRAGIGSLGDAAAILRGEAGTTIAPGQTLSFW